MTDPARDGDAGEPPGRLGPYVVTGRLGAGGMGMVLAARDPALERTVAIKLLWPGDEACVQHEARAMARLAHPNVVTVYDVGRHRDQGYIAMELADGPTLRAWQHARRRDWRELVARYVAAGRGLAAAHTARLVHRDFKPDNVVLGGDGRPRVTDFGLVAVDGDAGSGPAGARPRGTRAYMSPEQWRGGPVDARSDQYAFCVALWEALWDELPFAGAAADERGADAIAAPSSARRVPRAIVRALRRGLAIDPDARWPTLAALLDELDRIAAVRRRRTLALAATALGLAATAAVVLATDDRAAHPCATADAALAAVWPPARSAPLDGAPALVTRLDDAARAWSAMSVDACRATHVEGRQSPTMLERRTACLARRLDELALTIAEVERAAARRLEGADARRLEGAAQAVRALTPLDGCAEIAALAEAPAAPAHPIERALAEALARRTTELVVAVRAGRLAHAAEDAAALRELARWRRDDAGVRDALGVEARALLAAGAIPDAARALRELALAAAAVRDDRETAFAWTRLVGALGVNASSRREALALVPAARAAILRAGDPAALHAELRCSHAALVLDRHIECTSDLPPSRRWRDKE